MSVMIVGKNVVKDVIEGGVDCIEKLAAERECEEIDLLKSCICEGLELAQNPTFEGLHALARLICLSKIVTIVCGEQAESNGTAVITCDALLSFLISPVFDDVDASQMFGDLSNAGVSLVTRDADIVAALLCVKAGDNLYTDRFAQVLKAVEIEMVEASTEERREWVVSDEFISEQRAMVFSGGGKLH